MCIRRLKSLDGRNISHLNTLRIQAEVRRMYRYCSIDCVLLEGVDHVCMRDDGFLSFGCHDST